jgi:hypothetical protein
LSKLLPLACLLLAVQPASSRAEESYYVLIFGSQSQPKQLRYTHTWATFVRAVGEGSDPANYQIYAHTISWYPASMRVRVWSPFPERGVNLSLEQTLATVYANGERVTLWGPFLLRAPAYNRSLQVYNILNSGRAQYRAISTTLNLLIADCIHAVAAVDPDFGRGHYPLIRIGEPASRFIAREIMVRSPARGVYQECYDNSWLIPRLGLVRYPITVVPPWQIPRRRCVLCLLPE